MPIPRREAIGEHEIVMLMMTKMIMAQASTSQCRRPVSRILFAVLAHFSELQHNAIFTNIILLALASGH